ncbi:helix-turn-helix transcriptional regulator [Streptomyces sp. GbtcB7]|uniref:helix-turn-helix domain-containing protein n=1 Tax=Streptomyces sp. GbtcB7 TaxID=2824752 RepID=UPI001C2F49CF|nr:helix-turn-helix transcriptional regulator [Streptomyces sp. GbtcB7]
MGAAEETADFAALLRELKQRSGLSYEALAKRAHMSTSTLHRYCKGEGVPADHAAVSRFARVCKATPEELVELHRRWVLADAARERARRAAADSEPDRADRAGASTSGPGQEPCSAQGRTDQPQPEAVSDTAPPPAPAQPTASATAPTSMSEPGDPPGSVVEPSPGTAVLARRTPTLLRTARRRWALVAASTAVVVAVSTALTADLKGGGTDLAENGRPADTVTSSGQPTSAAPRCTHRRPCPPPRVRAAPRPQPPERPTPSRRHTALTRAAPRTAMRSRSR